jgi:hypothetical protein
VTATSVTLAYRPVRVGFLLRNSQDDFMAAVGYCTQLWGGIHNLMLPVESLEDRDWVGVVIHRYCVDVLVSIGSSAAIDAVVEEHAFLHWPSGTIGDNPMTNTGIPGERLSLFDMRVPFSDYWQREGRHMGESRAMLPTWNADDEMGLLFATTFGMYPVASSLPDLRTDFLRSTSAQAGNPRELSQLDWGSVLTPLETTRFGLAAHGTQASIESGLIGLNPGDVRELAHFWNLRAAGAYVIPVPTQEPDLFAPWIRHHSDELAHSWKSGDGKTEGRSIRYVHPNEDSPSMEWLSDLLPNDMRVDVSGELRTQSLSDRHIGNLPPSAEPRAVLATYGEKYGQEVLTVPLEPNIFRDADPGAWDDFQQLAISFETPSVPRDRTFHFPLINDLNRWLGDQVARGQFGSFRLQPDGFALLTAFYLPSIDLAPIEVQTLVEKLLDRAGITARRNVAGDVALRIVRMMGGLRAAQLLRIRGVRNLLASEKARHAIKFQQGVELIRDRTPAGSTFQQFSTYWRSAATGGPLTPDEVFRVLLEREVLRVGISIKCPNCRLDPFIEADLVGARVRCHYCGEDFLIGPLVRGKEWAYRLSGLFAREGSPSGAVPTILSMGQLSSVSLTGPVYALPAHDLKLRDLTCEADLVALEVSREGLATVAIGECKARGGVDQNDLQNLKLVRSAIRNSGVECTLVFGVLRDSFSEQEIQMFREFAQECAGERSLAAPRYQSLQAPALILLTNRELESDLGLLGHRDDSLPHPSPFSLQDLADNSAARYLQVGGDD